MKRLTQERLKEMLHYDPETGIFRWLVRPTSRVKVGQVAGSIRKDGYIIIRIDNKSYLAHRLSWLYMEGYIPENEVDHLDGNPTNNRWKNLREVSHRCNLQNCAVRSTNKSGFPGVSWCKRSEKWRSNIMINGKDISLGYHKTALDAALARYTVEVWCPYWACNHRSELVRAIQREWPEFQPTP